jgi:protein-S-isoprenylcysteine O-methyltransferase Ste14
MPTRALGILAGFGAHAVLAVAVWFLYWFLKGGVVAATTGPLWIDWITALAFGVVHSALLHPKVREPLSAWITAPFYGLFFTVVTCTGLLGMILFWQSSPTVWWEFSGPGRWLIDVCWFGSWVGLFYSMWLNGLGYQSGWTPWSSWVRSQPIPPRKFHPRGAFRFMRHPVYLCFLGLVWFTPVMTADRAILTAAWTAYVFVGSYLKDERMAHYLGQTYRQYQARVPGYIGMLIGPLAKLSLPDLDAAPADVRQPSTSSVTELSSPQVPLLEAHPVAEGLPGPSYADAPAESLPCSALH